MNVTLVTAGAEGLGPQYISAVLKQRGHTIKLAFDPTLFDDKVFLNIPRLAKIFDYTNSLVDDILDGNPDVIGFTVVSDIYPWAQKLASELKRKAKDIPIIFGGIHPTLVPELVIKDPHVDILVRGEAEYAFADVVDALDKGKSVDHIANVWVKKHQRVIQNPLRPLVVNLDTLPFPDRTIFEEYVPVKDGYITVSGRGCLYSCSYCFNNPYRKIFHGLGRFVRRRTPENFIAELIAAKKRYDMEFVKIYDDIFTYDLAWLERFGRLYKKSIRLPYFCLGHPRYMSEPVIKILKSSGCEFIQIGIQSMDEKVRRESCERYETNEQIFTMLHTLDTYKLKYELDHIFGLPGDTIETYNYAATTYNNCSSLLKINTNILSYIPKSSIIDKSLKSKQIRKKDLKSIDKGTEGSRVVTGSERDAQKSKLYQNYLVLYKLIRFIPKQLLPLILRYRLYSGLRFLEPGIGYIARLIGMDTIDAIYIKLEIHLMLWWMRKKLLGIFRIRKRYSYV